MIDYTQDRDTICALATAEGSGGLAVIRVSGPKAIQAVQAILKKTSPLDLSQAKSHSLHFALIYDGDSPLDEVVIGLFRNPKSYTGEDVLEISCHASQYIIKRILELLVQQNVRMARAGEFSMRAFLQGKMDLSQAEAVADLIASENKAMHDVAFSQLRGGFSSELKELREQLLEFAAYVELELDFGEEDVEFADRTALAKLLKKIQDEVQSLTSSFSLGNAIKNGIPVVIIGKPNAGKSSLLNALLQEDRALVSAQEGTTRDSIEELWSLGSHRFRFIDTAGLRKTQDELEQAGISRTLKKMETAFIWLYIFDASETSLEKAKQDLASLEIPAAAHLIFVGNKVDKLEDGSALASAKANSNLAGERLVYVSAKNRENLEAIESLLCACVEQKLQEQGSGSGQKSIISNLRHYEALQLAAKDLQAIEKGMEDNLSGDLLALELRSCLNHLGAITGEVTPDDILGGIFGRFCIGK